MRGGLIKIKLERNEIKTNNIKNQFFLKDEIDKPIGWPGNWQDTKDSTLRVEYEV